MAGTALTYEPLAIVAEAGFPQAFRQTVADRVYRFVLYVNAAEDLLDALADDAVLSLPVERAYMVLRVEREPDTEGAILVFQRKLVPHREYGAAELALTFSEIVVAKRNLNGAGAFGSSVKGDVASQWPLSSGTA
jgi:hypothetical protein